MDREIYDNYDIYGAYASEAIKYLLDDHAVYEASSEAKFSDEDEDEDDYEPDEDEIREECEEQDRFTWEAEKERLDDFFNDGSAWLLSSFGKDGAPDGSFIFNTFDEMFDKAVADCEYYRIGEKDGDFYVKCSHHDGTDLYVIRKLTEAGKNLYDDWNYGDFGADLSERGIHQILFTNSRYSEFPNYCNKVYGEISESEQEIAKEVELEKEETRKKKHSRGR